MKKVKEALKAKGASDETVTEFEKGAQSFAKKIVTNFKDYDFFVGESMDPDGMQVSLLTTDDLFANGGQGRSDELSRGWNYTFRHSLEAWSH